MLFGRKHASGAWEKVRKEKWGVLMLPRNRVPEYPGEGESRVRGNVHARFVRGGTGDPARDDRPLLH